MTIRAFDEAPRRERADGLNAWAIRAVVWRDLTAIRRSKAVTLPMLFVPALLMIVLPVVLAITAQGVSGSSISGFIDSLPSQFGDELRDLPADEQMIVLIHGHLLAPLFLIIPLMVSAVLAADAFAGEKERRSLESMLHLPISDRELFIAKVATSLVPAIVVSWLGFVCYATVSNIAAWPIMQRVFLPTPLWLVVILWVAPAVALLGMGVMVRVSARARTTQEANQLGGAVIFPLIFLAVGQSTGLLLLDISIAIAVGGVIWILALALLWSGVRRFSRDRLAASV